MSFRNMRQIGESIADHLMISPVLLLFEYALTLDREVAIFWKRKATGASVLFLSNRYISLVAYSARIALMGHWSCVVRVVSYHLYPIISLTAARQRCEMRC